MLRYFCNYFSRKPLSAYFCVGEGMRRKRGAGGRGEDGSSRGPRNSPPEPHFGSIPFCETCLQPHNFHPAPRPSPLCTPRVPTSGRFPLPHDP